MLHSTRVDNFKITRLGNGFIRVDDLASGLVALFDREGGYRSGDLRRLPVAVHTAVCWEGRI